LGNITTHAQISAHVIAQLTRVRPDEDYLYLELGNFLTDVSQFRDPYACIHAKKSMFQKAVEGKLLLLGPPVVAAIISGWRKELLGQARPQERRYGALTRFLALMARSATHLIFAQDSPLAARTLGSLGLSLHPLPPAEVEHYLDTALTQYYPHEHLDFPPYRDPDKEPLDDRSSRQPPGSVRQIAYLRDHIQYIVEELTSIELEWVRRRNLAASDLSRHDTLVRLGHMLHAIEDYYFHSNFAELYQWGRLVSSNRARLQAGQTDHDRLLLLRGLDGITDTVPEGMSATRLRRRLARRLRYPVFDRGLDFGPVPSATYWSHPSKKSSQDATALVYTGGFGGNDIYHSISSGLVAFEELVDAAGAFEQLVGTQGIRQRKSTDLVLVRLLLSQEERRRTVTEKGHEDRLLQQHAAQLRDGSYLSAVQKLLDKGEVSKATADALKAAFQLDWELERKSKLTPGVGGFLIMLLSSLQREVDENENRANALDRADKSILNQATSNGASAETIGTHSLLAKDDKREVPLRATAVALAKHASASVAVLMAKRVNDTKSDERKGLDWDSILHHFLRCPNTGPQSWETSIISSLPGPTPEVDAVPDRPNHRMLGPDFRPEKLKALREGTKRKELEGYYQKLEDLEDRWW
jgi:hypothetical protein